MAQEPWISTREVLQRTNIHRRTLDTWCRRGHLIPPQLHDGQLFWHPSTIMTCLARVKKNRDQLPKDEGWATAQQNTMQAVHWMVARYLTSIGGSLPLAGVMISISKKRLEAIQERYTVILSEEQGQLVLRIANNPEWTGLTLPSPKP